MLTNAVQLHTAAVRGFRRVLLQHAEQRAALRDASTVHNGRQADAITDAAHVSTIVECLSHGLPPERGRDAGDVGIATQ